jgi:hypothetical protein
MKVIWDDLGRSIKLIVCAMGNYYCASIWIKEKAQIQSYSLKESIIVLIGMMFFIGLFGVAVTVELLRQIYICEWGIKLSFLRYEKKIEWEDFTVIQRYNDHFFFNISKQKDDSLFWCTYHPFTSIMIFDKFRAPSWGIIPLSADEFCNLLTSYGVKYTESK